MQVRNVFIIFVVSGFWHGANWTYLAWGFLNGLYFLPLLLLKRTNIENPVLSWNLSSVRVFVNILGTFYCPVALFFSERKRFQMQFYI
jgi:D-alanyl-lipoteichoic acid acyltransferase DltB (MBOAT superfamily)